MAAGARRAASVRRHPLRPTPPGRGRRLAAAAECRPWEGGEREYGRLPPQDLRGRDRRHSHCLDLDVGARLISVDLQEHVADAQGRALVMGYNDLDVFHGLSRATVEVIEIGQQVRPPDPQLSGATRL
jgi:hypothetical protein